MAGLGAGGVGGGGSASGLGSLLSGASLLAIGAGLAVGIVGSGALVASGAVRFGGSPAASIAPGDGLALVPCPDQGPVVGHIARGTQVLITGKSADGAWVQVFSPGPGFDHTWTRVGPLKLQGSLDAVPVVACEMPSVAPRDTPEPTAPPTTPPSAEPSAPPSAPPTPTPTPNAKPSASGLTVSTTTVSYDQGSYCPTAPKQVTFTVTARDSGGVASVTLYWRKPGASSYTPTPMARTGGTVANGIWTLTLDSTANSLTTAGSLAFYAVAKDAAGLSARVPTSGANAITVAVCKNTGPTITGASSSAGSTLYWDPLGVGTCQTATNITAAVADIDGVKSVTLYFRRPGSSTYSSKAMNNQTIPGKWYANLDTLGDKITIPTPPTGTLSWFIKAVDKKGMASQTKTSSIVIRRCDTAATFYVNSVGTQYTFCPQPPANSRSVNLVWSFSIADPDGLTSATLSYQIVNTRNSNSYRQTVTVPVKSQRFSISSAPIDGNSFYGSNSVTWTITTTDRYGGKSSASGKATVTIQIC